LVEERLEASRSWERKNECCSAVGEDFGQSNFAREVSLGLKLTTQMSIKWQLIFCQIIAWKEIVVDGRKEVDDDVRLLI
jgi:hypothetical protein